MTELVNQVNQSHTTELVALSVNAIAEVSIPLNVEGIVPPGSHLVL